MNPLNNAPSNASRPLSELMSDRIHYACGKNLLDGWLNVDGYDETYPYGVVDDSDALNIFSIDLTERHPFPEKTFNYGYCEDFLEHLDQIQSIKFLCEVYRTFNYGGVIRMSFPGLSGALRRHLRSSDFEGANILEEEAYTRWKHLHFYSFESLKIVAEHIGFSSVRNCEYGKSDYPELLHDSRFDQADLNLVIELRK